MKKKQKQQKKEEIPIKLSKIEQAYYDRQSNAKKRELNELMKRVSTHVLDEGDVPNKFKIL